MDALLRCGLYVVIVAASLVVSPVRAQRVLYVDADAAPGGDGASWATAFDDLQEALALVEAGDEVWVAEGTYRPGDGTVQTGEREASFHLVDGAAVYGGFEGTEMSLEERDPEAHVTVLSGDLDGDGTYAGNAYHVVTASGTSASTVLDGFTITAGSADDYTPPHPWGGGLYGEEASLTVRMCRFEGNQAWYGGGGAYIVGEESRPRFEEVVFYGNHAGGSGGGLSVFGGEHVALSDVLFEANAAGSGAGAHVWGPNVELVRGRFVRNYATSSGGGLGIIGSEDAVIVGVTFYGNAVDPPDGSLGGGLHVTGSSILVANAVFVGNMARVGAGSSIQSSYAVLTNVAFSRNEAEADGGALRSSNASDVTLSNALLWQNAAPQGPEIQLYGLDLNVRQAIVSGGCPDGITCEGVFDADPLFTRDPDPGPDGAWGTEDDDYGDLQLLEGSPAEDAGLAVLLPPDRLDLDSDGDTAEPLPLDLAGAPRVQGAEVDLGPFEHPRPVSTEPSPLDAGRLVVQAPFPNPARGTATLPIRLGAASAVEVAVYDALGRRVGGVARERLAAGPHGLALAVSELPSGVYLVRVTAEGTAEAAVRRLVVAR